MLAGLAARIRALPADAPRLVGIDGVDGAGKTVLADELAGVLRTGGTRVIRVGIDGFHRPRAERYRRGRHSAAGYFRDSFDVEAFLASVVRPARADGSGLVRTAVFDHRADAPVAGENATVGAGVVVVVDGVFLHRDELADAWDLSVFLRVPLSVAMARMAAREGMAPDDPIIRRYREGQRLYLRTCDPEARADVVLDLTEVAAPVVVRGGLAAG